MIPRLQLWTLLALSSIAGCSTEPAQDESARHESVVQLGGEAETRKLFSISDQEELPATVVAWIDDTFKRDGLAAEISAEVLEEDGRYVLKLRGDREICSSYVQALDEFLANGRSALEVFEENAKKPDWDPRHRGWKFLLPLGLPMLDQRSVQFFHYPPNGLLKSRDYLHDPVPKRWEMLLIENGADAATVALYETIVDGAPIAAPDDAGPWIPMALFPEYQRAQLQSLVREAPAAEGYTIPVVVYGVAAMHAFERLFEVPVDVLVAQTATISPGLKTAVLGANHPYHFLATAQIPPGVGSGTIGGGCEMASKLMVQDLIAACWQVGMAEDPSQDPSAQLDRCADYWARPENASRICSLVRQQGSLLEDGNAFRFGDPTIAAQFCEANQNDPCADIDSR